MTSCLVNHIMKFAAFLLFVVLLTDDLPWVHGSRFSSPGKEDLSRTTEKLIDHIYKYQAKRDSQTFLPFKWGHKKGIYESDVKLYFHGKPIMSLIRDQFAVYDVNMFATAWINFALLEAYSFNKIAKPSAQNLEQSLEAISQFSNHNVNYSNSVMCFWPQEYNETTQMWESSPKNLLHLVKFSNYLPFDFIDHLLSVFGLRELEKDIDNIISMKHFLEDAANKGRDVALVSTWVQNINESRKLFAEGVAMPFNVNNVDCAVAANTIYGITSGVLSGLLPASILDDPDIQQIYLNTSSMLEWQLRTRLSDRTDLALPYYPSLLEFYWFVSRTVSAVERARLQGNIPHKALEEAYQLLSEAQRTATTEHILSLATREATGVYFDGFIGDADSTNKAEDRLFTTSVAVNALQGIWTVYDHKSGKNIWIKETPQNVIETVTSTVTFLQENVFNNRYRPWNAFFSGSVKGLSTLPFLYPFNRFDNSTTMIGRVMAMEGTISEEEYIAKTKEPVPMMGNMTTPMEFHGFNKEQNVFPFWTSEPYTYATTLLALSHFQNTEKRDA
ncbi:uncharacterized protein LOC106878628 [Octopus bimaculoides]|uniref:Uncharacterized protein n=1 Tax=Octopus bimaculoides TaxID=37653 RepID=A0A0L8G7D0_OCTBM|nr:uncharacterized protein LOC106878628 [Octopus bimaculoides]|eukprot:XP_014783392.1 PREDICTED: uncharacterized protein LOC106878628 [Octopus bimaculoides]